LSDHPAYPHSPPTRPPSGQTLLADGRYILVRKVAEGGTASVHLGYDTWTDQWRAVKTLLPEYAKRPALRHRFECEAATMKSLSHTNIIAVYDAGTDDEKAWMVMEFAEGGSVIDWVEQNGAMPPRMASQVVLQLCEGIVAAHEDGVIHRDIKPQNLLVDREGVCKVTDFGIAQVVQEARMTMTGTVMGTIGYMAPEQHESAKHADERADVYSIAATYYTLVRGEAATHLFMADGDEFLGLPDGIADIIRKGSQYRRDARYPDVRAMANALAEVLAELPMDPADTPPLVPLNAGSLDGADPPNHSAASAAPPPSAEIELRKESSVESIASPPSLTTTAVFQDSLRERSQDSQISHGSRSSPSSLAVSSRGAGHRAVHPYSRHEQIQRRSQVKIAVRIGLFAAAFAVLALLMYSMLSGMLIDMAETQESTARNELFDAVQNQLSLLPKVEPLADGLSSYESLQALFDQIGGESDPQIRLVSARQLHDLIQTDMPREIRADGVSSREQSALRQLEASAEAVGNALYRHSKAQGAIERRRRTPGGWLATRFGF